MASVDLREEVVVDVERALALVVRCAPRVARDGRAVRAGVLVRHESSNLASDDVCVAECEVWLASSALLGQRTH